ncbi:MAG TPA: hypothetical protein DCL21_00835, partial [Alphaproteobacteria bacterium]|nr:hypothetical protein [Alphaproteobacteria bacterium]
MKKTLLILVYSIFASNCMAEIRTNTDSTLVNNTVNSMVKVEGMLKDGDYSKEQKDEIRKKVLTTSIMVGDFYIGMLKRTCKKDIQLLCSKTKGAKLADCLNNNRTKVNEFKCFNYIEHVFGASPIEKNFNFRGLEIPAGSLVSFKTATKEWPTRVKLSKPTVYRGITFSDESYLQIRPKVYYFKGRKIISDDAFIIKSGGVIGDFTAAGIKYKANERHAAFEKDGCLKYGNVAEDTKIDDITIPAGSYLHLSRAGEIFNIRLSKDSTIRGQHIVAGRNIGFNSNNNMVIRLDEPYDNPLKEITIDGIKYINFVAINKQGKVARGVLANPTRINNKLYPDYTLITVNKNGEVIRSSQMERPAKELKVGDKVKNPNYLFAIEAKSRFYSQDAFEEKDLLKFLSISNLIHSSGLPTKGVKIKQVFLPGSEFTITDLKSKSIGPHTTSEMILVDNQG